jgi:hypothetical protein
MKKYTLQIGLIIILLGLFALPAWAGEGTTDTPRNLSMSASARQGDAGASVNVAGAGAQVGTPVYVTLAPRATSAEGAFVTVQVSPAADGSFSTSLTIPAEVPDGIYFIRAEQFSGTGGVVQYYWQAFTVGTGGGVSLASVLPETGTVEAQAVSPALAVLSSLMLGLIALLLMRGGWGVWVNRVE